MPPLSLLIKPSSGMCNLSCKYCFYHDITAKRMQESYGFMKESTIEHIIKKALAFSDGHCTIGFQGGEPTLIGLPFFEKIMELEETYNVKKIPIYNCLQTNGFGLSEEWAVFFAKHNFLVGVSIDGTIHSHDLYRRTANDQPTFKEIMKTLEFFDKQHVTYNILTVVNQKTASSIQKIYRFYQKNNFQHLQFIPCLDPIGEVPGKQNYSLTPEQYGRFLCELFDLWHDDIKGNKPIYIRQFENYISMFHGYAAESCDMNGFCSVQHIIESDGEVYPCDFFVFDQYKLGNLNDLSFEEIARKRQELRFMEESIITNQECIDCPYYRLCRGGCKRYRAMAGSEDYQYNYFCPSFKMFFAHCAQRIAELSRKMWRKQ